MIDKNTLENYMLDLSLVYEDKGNNMWLIKAPDRGLENVVVALNDPLVIIRAKVMNVPTKNKEAFFEQLLHLNATDMVHGAYAIDGNSVILIDTLEGATMEKEEFEASLDAIGMALTQHYPKLRNYR
jgi:hypothetical protein